MRIIQDMLIGLKAFRQPSCQNTKISAEDFITGCLPVSDIPAARSIFYIQSVAPLYNYRLAAE